MRLSKTKIMSSRPMILPWLLNVSVTGSSMLFLMEEQKITVKVLKAQAQSQKARLKMEIFEIIKKIKSLLKKVKFLLLLHHGKMDGHIFTKSGAIFGVV
uniref:Uncharacterized protein n=1 Tax=Equus asinus asinus TaxID=83772 RepID=A0A8C4LR32_EQUAS